MDSADNPLKSPFLYSTSTQTPIFMKWN